MSQVPSDGEGENFGDSEKMIREGELRVFLNFSLLFFKRIIQY